MPEFDIVDGVWTMAPPEGKDIRLDTSGDAGHIRMSGVVKLDNADGADPANALLLGVGTTADPALSAVAGKVFIEIRAKTSATSGDNRLAYLRYDIGGAGASGEAIRAFTDLTAAAATARGAHISLQAGATGYITGLGVGVDAQLYIKNEVLHANGTYAVLNAEIYSAGSTSAVSGATQLAYIRCVAGGDVTGVGRVDDKVYLLSINGTAVGTGNMVVASTTEANYSHAARCYLEGVGDVWLMFASTSG